MPLFLGMASDDGFKIFGAVAIDHQVTGLCHHLLGFAGITPIDTEGRNITSLGGSLFHLVVLDTEGPCQNIHLGAEPFFQDGLGSDELLVQLLLELLGLQFLFVLLEIGMPEGVPLQVKQTGLL